MPRWPVSAAATLQSNYRSAEHGPAVSLPQPKLGLRASLTPTGRPDKRHIDKTCRPSSARSTSATASSRGASGKAAVVPRPVYLCGRNNSSHIQYGCEKQQTPEKHFKHFQAYQRCFSLTGGPQWGRSRRRWTECFGGGGKNITWVTCL